MNRIVNIAEVTGQARVRGLHLVILLVCFLTAVVDGVDNQVIGFSAPAISAALKIPMAKFGIIFSAGLIGTLVGAVVMGRLADWIGRRQTLIVCTLLFGALTVLNTLATNFTELCALRFIGGLGIGGAMPGFLTLVSEYAPKHRRALATGLLWCGYPFGGVVGGIIGAQLIPHYGWTGVFYVGGAMALIAACLQALFLPESLQFLVTKRTNPNRVARILARLAPDIEVADATFVTDVQVARRVSVGEVFAEGRTLPTLLLWLPLFMTFMITTFAVLWLPALFKSVGIPIATAALLTALGNFSTLPSQAVSGFLLDKVGPYRVLPIAYLLLAINMAVLSFALHAPPVLTAAIIFNGFLQGPGIAGMLFLATSLYPSEVRSTGVGLAMGIGRSGQVFGSLFIGWLISMNVAAHWIILGMCAAPLIALLCVLLMALVRPRSAGAAATATA